ncbi:DsbA family oxidoreductase [Aquisalimonas asiatica]|uniref:Predicted dithiol-disulfide isomerase, DsbA family n=1 Tax=Aquisalimonas asiatica TaxID=406100 RepID=A0A1H8V0P7_9GAMM|nr:DsbA family oxidoreductase [Aquisalimonas asiatica]SEP08803.1 Predicted dithiol-disulfide isomerase, DsbA family [Aquisalimonas asiatica]
MNHLTLDIVSDVACPWCAIGYKRLELAMAEVEGEITFDVRWQPFQLNPDMPPEGEDILEHLTGKYGRSAEEMQAAQQQMTDIAHGLGLDFSRMQERRAHNTFDAHRLLAWAAGQGRQTALNLALFDAYFGQALNPSDPAVLQDAAESVGLPGDAARQLLSSDDYAEQVRREEAYYKQAGVTGVPAFIIAGRYVISGAQEPQTLANAFREIAAEQPASA